MTEMVFIISLPRSGSTLLQRILASSEEVYCPAEPWFLFPFISDGTINSTYSIHGTNLENLAKKEFIENDVGAESFRQLTRNYIENVYRSAAEKNGARVFVDKTPRYSLYLDQLVELFPEAKFIVLTRDPIAIVSSILKTWSKGKWKIYNYKSDLMIGNPNIVAFLNKSSSLNNVMHVKYEDLVAESTKASTIKSVFEFIGVKSQFDACGPIDEIQINGTMGDPLARVKYKSISGQSLDDSYSGFLVNPYRKLWAKNYLKFISADGVRTLGYSYDEILARIEPYQWRGLLCSDFLRVFWGGVYDYLSPKILYDKILNLKSGDGSNNVGHR